MDVCVVVHQVKMKCGKLSIFLSCFLLVFVYLMFYTIIHSIVSYFAHLFLLSLLFFIHCYFHLLFIYLLIIFYLFISICTQAYSYIISPTDAVGIASFLSVCKFGFTCLSDCLSVYVCFSAH